ncbi:MAG: hypothetical protein LBU83_08665 [Bacteroidales bacterium]|jgi:hypothetical protein|nr:hypothetical protein [Bacteroidales bacterium]
MKFFFTINRNKILFLFSLFLFSFSFGFCEILQTDTTLKPQKVKTVPNLRLGVQVGYGYRFASIPYSNNSVLNKHFNKLKHCLSIGADFSYFFKSYIGVGVKYNGIFSHTITENVTFAFEDGSNEDYKQFSESLNIHYFGAFLATQIFIVPKKHCLFANVGAGYARCRNNTFLVKIDNNNNLSLPFEKRESTTITKNGAAIFAEIGYDFFVIKSFAIGLRASLLIDLKKTKLSKPESLNHIDFSLAFSFYNM